MTETKEEIIIPEGAVLIDEAFYVWKTRYGLHSTMTVQGRKMLTGLKKEDVVEMTRWHLKCEIDGTLEEHTRVIGDAYVGGKL
jgi:hypothetical protein|tara:strand:+ start:579 stop:827 length:249 start_codon:yes stop_codon:yes gene_type:complete